MKGNGASGLSRSYRYHEGILLRTSEYFHWKGLAVFLIEPDVAQDLAFQVGDGGEDASVDHIALEFTEQIST